MVSKNQEASSRSSAERLLATLKKHAETFLESVSVEQMQQTVRGVASGLTQARSAAIKAYQHQLNDLFAEAYELVSRVLRKRFSFRTGNPETSLLVAEFGCWAWNALAVFWAICLERISLASSAPAQAREGLISYILLFRGVWREVIPPEFSHIFHLYFS